MYQQHRKRSFGPVGLDRQDPCGGDQLCRTSALRILTPHHGSRIHTGPSGGTTLCSISASICSVAAEIIWSLRPVPGK